MVEMAQGNIPFFEKNLKEIIRRNVRAGRLAYSTDIESFARKTPVIFLAEDKAETLNDVAMRIVRLAPKPPILTIVTPVPVGTANALEKSIKDAGLQATIVSQPMFFTDGCAVEDFNWPDRLILGSTSIEAVQMLKQIFHPLVMRGVPVIVTNQATAELVREAATAFVATKISFINEVAALCERVNADAVNCTPWSVLKTSGLPRSNASSNRSRQNSPSSVFDSRQARTYRLCQSITAARYMNPVGNPT